MSAAAGNQPTSVLRVRRRFLCALTLLCDFCLSRNLQLSRSNSLALSLSCTLFLCLALSLSLALSDSFSASGVPQVGDVVGISDLQAGGLIAGEDVTSSELFLDSIDGQLDHDLCPYNLQFAQFVVTPKHEYYVHRQIDDLLNKRRAALASLSVSINATDLTGMKIAQLESLRKKLAPTDRLLEEIDRVCMAYESEQKANEMEFNRALGHPVLYGAVIQLKHLRSGKFVTQSRTRAKVDPQAMALCLVEEGNKGSWLKIQSADLNRAEGEHVRIGDQVYVTALKFPGTFITVFGPEDKGGGAEGRTTPAFSRAGSNVGAPLVHPPSPEREKMRVPRPSLGTLSVDDAPSADEDAEGVGRRLEVNAASQPYDLQIKLIRTWKTHVQWLQAMPGDDDSPSCQLAGAHTFSKVFSTVTFT
jgi:hypothetical protein